MHAITTNITMTLMSAWFRAVMADSGFSVVVGVGVGVDVGVGVGKVGSVAGAAVVVRGQQLILVHMTSNSVMKSQLL